MFAKQANPLSRNPNHLNLVQVAELKRSIDANIVRVWENVLDWEHLPWLHDSSFDFVRLDAAGDWGWRTWSDPDHKGHVELCVNREQSEYVARSYQGGQQISEIWTRLTETGDSTDIIVTFELPDVPDDKKDRLGEIFLGLYTRLWDEDEAMMRQREYRLAQRYADPADHQLILPKPVKTPITVSLGRGDWTLREIEGELVAHSAICPHLLGPLDDTVSLSGTRVRCPWHGYEFDVHTGKCLTDSAAPCQLKQPPTIEHTDQQIILTLNH